MAIYHCFEFFFKHRTVRGGCTFFWIKFSVIVLIKLTITKKHGEYSGCKLEDESAEQWMAIATPYATSICVKNWIKIKAAENRSVLTLWWQGVECIANKTVLFVKNLKVPGEPHLFDSQMTEIFF